MRIRQFLIIFMPLVVSCATHTNSSQDQMCAQLATFASMTKPGESHSITLRGGWGGDTPNTLMTHDCNHSGYEPGKTFCAYLVPNTSWEFGNYNARRAAACLDSSTRYEFIRRMDKYDIPAEITSSMQMLTDKNILVTVRLEAQPPSTKNLSDLSVLTLTASYKK